MEDIFTQLKKAQEVKMTNAERSAIRQQLMNISLNKESTQNPARPQVSPYTSSLRAVSVFVKVAAFALMGFIVGGTSLTFASLKALPGDSLYAIKTNVTEKIASSLTFSTESKARANANQVATRVSEIAAVRAHGSINNADIAHETEASFNATFNTYTESLKKLSSEGRVARSQEIATETLLAIKTVAPEKPVPVAAMMSAAPAFTSKTMVAPVMMMQADVSPKMQVQASPILTGLDSTLAHAVEKIEAITNIENENKINPTLETPETTTPDIHTPTEATTTSQTTVPPTPAVIKTEQPEVTPSVDSAVQLHPIETTTGVRNSTTLRKY